MARRAQIKKQRSSHPRTHETNEKSRNLLSTRIFNRILAGLSNRHGIRVGNQLLNGLDHFQVKSAAAVSDTKGAVIDMSASPAGNLSHLCRYQLAHSPSIIFNIGCQRDMVKI